MRPWNELERNFAAVWGDTDPYIRLDVHDMPDGPVFRIAGSGAIEAQEKFIALARMAGQKLLDHPSAADWPMLVSEPDPVRRWYLALRQLTRSYKMDRPVIMLGDDGSETFVGVGVILGLGRASAALCATLESLAAAPTVRVSALRSVPRYAGPCKHWNSALKLMQQDEPDNAKAAHEAVSAVEGLCRIVLDDSSVTLGDALKVLRSRKSIPLGISRAIEGLWIYTSAEPGVRHGGATLPAVGAQDARFVLATSEAALEYLLALDSV